MPCLKAAGQSFFSSSWFPPCRVALFAGQCTAGICHSDLFLRLQSGCYRNLNRQSLGLCREPSSRCLLPNIHINISHRARARSECVFLSKEPLKCSGFTPRHLSVTSASQRKRRGFKIRASRAGSSFVRRHGSKDKHPKCNCLKRHF